MSWKLLNLASLESIEKCSNSILADESRIDLLVLNAGSGQKRSPSPINMLKGCVNLPLWPDLMSRNLDSTYFAIFLAGVLVMSDSPKMKRTSDGFELHMGINYFGHYALTRRLLGLMRSTAKSSADGARLVLKTSISVWNS